MDDNNKKMNEEKSTSWVNTQIWKIIKKKKGKDAEKVQNYLNDFLEKIEKILKKGGTSSKDFTLHDEEHSFRVAKRMHEIAGDTLKKISIYDLALLLTSAYLHDIGMTPEEAKVNNHYKYLLTGEKNGITDNEIEQLNCWLDDDDKGISLPICSKTPTSKDIELAEELLTYYCRHCHNDWSKEWIEKNQKKDDLCDYSGFKHDLIKLCQSHHYGIKELEANDFNARIVGHNGEVVHLRYLACLLRIADILEFDPERTPEVILRHREIAKDSLIYWYYNHQMSFTIENNRLILSARPTNAIIHKAIEDMCDQIDYELQLCRMLADTSHFENCPGLAKKLPHKWNLVSALHRDIEPSDNAYEYINGAFRPNTEKILEMLSGIELYGDNLTAIRELLQNAFDAVREQIAYERFKNRYPKDKELTEAICKLHKVELRFEKRGEEYWLVCTDTGVGMNKRIIRDHLLISGQPKRHDIASLERKCKEAGFNLGRTGKFGIGVLSYFMIADHLIISTRRSLEPKDSDTNGWIFETRGVGTFGELRRDVHMETGSRIELHLKKDVLTITPCEFQLTSAIPECKSLVVAYGWNDDAETIRNDIANGFRDYNYFCNSDIQDLLPKVILDGRLAKVDRLADLRNKICMKLKWISEEGELPNGLGQFRIRIPYFLLSGGPSLIFLDDEKCGDTFNVKELLEGFYFEPTFFDTVSWKGMLSSLPRTQLRGKNFKIECDFQNQEAGTLQVSRNMIMLSPQGNETLNWVNKKAKKLWRKVLKENANSNYGLLNCRVANQHESIKNPKWLTFNAESPEQRKLQEIKFPAILSQSWKYEAAPKKVQYKGRDVTVLCSLGTERSTNHYDGVNAISLGNHPDKILLAKETFELDIANLWLKSPYKNITTNLPPKTSFPPKWKNIAGIKFTYEDTILWNKTFKILKYVHEDDFKWLQDKKIDPLPISDILLKKRGYAVAWLLNFMLYGNKDVWNGLVERVPGFLKSVWRNSLKLYSKNQEFNPIILYIDNTPYSKLITVLPDGWQEYRCSHNMKLIKSYMPDPGDDWKLKIIQ